MQLFPKTGRRSSGAPGRRSLQVAAILALTIGMGTIGVSPASASRAPAAAFSSSATPASQLGGFDVNLLQLINDKRVAANLVPLSEFVGLDQISQSWSGSGASKGLYATLGTNAGLANQVAAMSIPGNVSYAQSVAKWYPQSVKVANVFALYVGYPDALAKIMNPAFRYVGIKTAIGQDGTSVATLTFTDSANTTQIVNPVIVLGPPAASRHGS